MRVPTQQQVDTVNDVIGITEPDWQIAAVSRLWLLAFRDAPDSCMANRKNLGKLPARPSGSVTDQHDQPSCLWHGPRWREGHFHIPAANPPDVGTSIDRWPGDRPLQWLPTKGGVIDSNHCHPTSQPKYAFPSSVKAQ